MDDFEVREVVEIEGLEYAVRHYMNSSKISNPVTADLWDKANAALNDLVKHLHLDED